MPKQEPREFKRIEMTDLDNPEEWAVISEMIGKLLIQCGPPSPIQIIKVSDDTQEGRIVLRQLLDEGYKIVSIKD